MIYKFVIKGKLDGLNKYTAANRTNPYAGGRLKKQNEEIIIWSIREHLRGLIIDKRINIHYKFYEENRCRDKDNIASTSMKFVQDSLVKCGVLKGDGWKEIEGFTHEFYVDKKNPRIEVYLEEIKE